MILSSHHQLLVSSSRTTTSTNDMTPALLLVSEEEQLTSSNDEAPAPVTPTNAVSTAAPFPASDSPPSRHYDYSVGHFASPKSEGTTSKRTCSCWKLNDFTSTTPDSFAGTSTGSSSHLGEGMFGTVDLYKERNNDNLLVALKTMSKAESNDRRRLLWKREVELQTRLSHSNILQCYGFFQTSTQLHMVLEFASLGNLNNYVSDGKPMQAPAKNRLVRHVASSLAHLVSHRIAHRDVKTENVLVCLDEHGLLTAKLADFGYAVYCGPSKEDDDAAWRMTLCGTLACVPPEMLAVENFGSSDYDEDTAYNALCVDAWALGVLAYELITEEALFDVENNNRNELKDAIWNFEPAELVAELAASSYNDPSFGDFCAKLLNPKPKERLTPSQALDHVWLSSLVHDDANKKKRGRRTTSTLLSSKRGQQSKKGRRRRRRQP